MLCLICLLKCFYATNKMAKLVLCNKKITLHHNSPKNKSSCNFTIQAIYKKCSIYFSVRIHGGRCTHQLNYLLHHAVGKCAKCMCVTCGKPMNYTHCVVLVPTMIINNFRAYYYVGAQAMICSQKKLRSENYKPFGECFLYSQSELANGMNDSYSDC